MIATNDLHNSNESIIRVSNLTKSFISEPPRIPSPFRRGMKAAEKPTTYILSTFSRKWLIGVKKRRFVVMQGLSLEIFAGEFFVLLGPSGSGKSTLLRLMSGLEQADVGEVALQEGITFSHISFVFQQFALLPWLTVSENVELPLLPRFTSKDERQKKALKELKRLGLEGSANAYPKELSGGMRQRVGIARAFVTDPKLIFMDEPFSELDSFTAYELRKELLTIWQETPVTIVMVTHLIEEAVELGDRIAVLSPPPTAIERIVTNDLARPRHKRSEDVYKLEDLIYKLVKP